VLCSQGRSSAWLQQAAGELFADVPVEACGTETAEILVEVVETRHEVADRDAVGLGPLAETGGGAHAGIVDVAGDDELGKTGG
jgi:hypothetical protein